VRFYRSSSYHQKVALEVPLLETKAVHGLAVPIEYQLPANNPLWTKASYDSFNIAKAVENKVCTIALIIK
jgi:hypothetical protein